MLQQVEILSCPKLPRVGFPVVVDSGVVELPFMRHHPRQAKLLARSEFGAGNCCRHVRKQHEATEFY